MTHNGHQRSQYRGIDLLHTVPAILDPFVARPFSDESIVPQWRLPIVAASRLKSAQGVIRI